MNTLYRTVACILSMATAAQAQQGSASSAPTNLATTGSVAQSSDQLEEIVITAQRRSERLQDVPVAVTALSAAKLKDSGISSSQDLSMVTPGLTEPESAGYSQPHIRGVGSSTNGPGLEQPVATYIDGVYIAAATSAMMSLNNVDRVEVLKGPQGTLFGRNSTGGLIQVVTKDPASDPSGDFSLSYGNYNDVVTSGYVTGPLADKLNGDIAVRYETQPEGWGRNLDTGRQVYNLPHDLATRVKFLFEPSEGTQIRLTADYEDRASTLSAQKLDFNYPTKQSYENTLYGPFPQGGRYDINENFTSVDTLDARGISLQVKQDFGSASFQSITAYRDSAANLPLDLDHTPVDRLDLYSTAHDAQFSQEFQLSSAAASKLNWTTGVFYYHAIDKWDPFNVDIPAAGLTLATIVEEHTNSIAGYGQAAYEILPDTNLTLGGRYTSEKKSESGENSTLVEGFDVQNTPLPAPGSGIPSSLDFHRINYRIALDHKFTRDIMGYISYNTGFKSGGFNLNVPTQAPYLPEDIRAAEVGLKTEFFDRRARINIAGYYYKYKNIQVGRFVDQNETIINGAGAKIYGVDLDAEFTVAGGFNLSGGFSYNHSRFTSFPDADYIVPVNGVAVPPDAVLTGSAKGNVLPYAPQYTFDVAADYKVALPFGTLSANITDFQTSKIFGAPDNVSYQPAYGLVNTYLAWTHPDGRFSVKTWAKNLFDTYYATEFNEANDHVVRVNGAPRTYGLTVGYRF